MVTLHSLLHSYIDRLFPYSINLNVETMFQFILLFFYYSFLHKPKPERHTKIFIVCKITNNAQLARWCFVIRFFHNLLYLTISRHAEKRLVREVGNNVKRSSLIEHYLHMEKELESNLIWSDLHFFFGLFCMSNFYYIVSCLPYSFCFFCFIWTIEGLAHYSFIYMHVCFLKKIIKP